MNPQADVVKKGSLKFKTSKVRGTAGQSTQGGPKQFKDQWFVFRSLSGGHKVLDYYLSEKRFTEHGSPKGSFNLKDAVSVQYHNPDKKNQFCVEMGDGGMCFFEARAEMEGQQWLSCLNAVLFAKGATGEDVLQYDVDLTPTSHLDYSGPCCLELRGENLIVWTSDLSTQVARWKLAHIRSFKAKKNLLSIFAGSRSSTGACEFYFQCDQSVEITHAIETVVQKLRNERSAQSSSVVSSRNRVSDRRPLPALPMNPREASQGSASSPDSNRSSSSAMAMPELLEMSAAARQPSASLIATIPPAYEDLDKSQRGEEADSYGCLDHNVGSSHCHINTSAAVPLPLADGSQAYGRLDKSAVGGGGGGGGSSSSSSSAAKSKKMSRLDYEDLDLDDELAQQPAEEYGKLDHNPLPATKSKDKDSPSKSPSASKKFKSIFKKKKSPTPPKKPPPYQPGTQSEEVYSEIETATALNVTSAGYNKLSRTGENRSSARLNEGDQQSAQYSQLNHTSSESEIPVVPESYRALDHNVKKQITYRRRPESQPLQDAYGKLDHHNVPVATPIFDQDYGQLNLTPAHQPEEYGKLEHGKAAPIPKRMVSPPEMEEEYGKLDHGLAAPPAVAPDYACLEDPQQGKFDPYGTLNEHDGVYDDTLDITHDVTSNQPEEGRRKAAGTMATNGDIYSVVSKSKKPVRSKARDDNSPPPPAIPSQIMLPAVKPRSYVNVDGSGKLRNGDSIDTSGDTPPLPPRRGVSVQSLDNGPAKPRLAPKPKSRAPKA